MCPSSWFYICVINHIAIAAYVSTSDMAKRESECALLCILYAAHRIRHTARAHTPTISHTQHIGYTKIKKIKKEK